MSAGPDDRNGRPSRVRIEIPFATIARLLVAALLVVVVLKLWLLFLIFLVAVLFAVTLYPVVSWLQNRGFSRGVAVATVGVTVLALILAFAVFVLPPLVGQLIRLGQNFPAYRDRVEAHIPADQPFLKEIASEIFDLPTSPGIRRWH